MWVIMSYVKPDKEKQHHVGFFDKDSFVSVCDFAQLGDAMDTVHYLNGGTDRSDVRQLLTSLTRIQHELTDIRGQLRFVR